MGQSDLFLRRIFQRFLWPTVLSVLGGTVNTLVDCAIVGNLMGASALAAVNLCGPIFLLCSTAGSLIGSGAGLLSAAFIGRNEEKNSCLCYTLATVAELLCGLLLAAVGLLCLDPAVRLLGADDELLPMTLAYARIAFWGAPVKCLLYVPFNFLRLDGKPGAVSISLLAMTACNGILDYLFIQWGWGLAGASLASVLGTCLGVGIGFWSLWGGSFRLVRLKRCTGILRELLTLGTPPALNNLLSMARLILLNRILMELGGSAWVAVFTVVCSISDFALCIISGVPQTASPLVGIYHGERNNAGLRQLVRMQFIYGGLLIGVFALCTALFPAGICVTLGLMYSAQAAFALRLLALSLPFAMLCSILIFFYNALGRVGLANIITFCRAFLFTVGPAFLLSRFGGLVWWFLPLSELLTLLTLWPILTCTARRNPALSPLLLLDETLDREGKVIDFSVRNSPREAAEAAERIGDFCNNNGLSAKQTMAVSLSIEEMLIVQMEHCFQAGDENTVDVRVFAVQGVLGLRIRNAGRQFNPVAYYESRQGNDEVGEALGVRMILKLAEEVRYQRTFGVNTLTILF